MLLKNYYTSLCAKDTSTTDAVMTGETDINTSPRFSTSLNGQKHAVPQYSFPFNGSFVFYYGNYNVSQSSSGNIDAGNKCWFGNSNVAPSFEDYSVNADTTLKLTSTYKSVDTSYNESTKTYTRTWKYVLYNGSSNALDIKEIYLGFTPSYGNGVGSYLVTHDLLGENEFTIEAGESVNFELTILYTIAQALQ